MSPRKRRIYLSIIALSALGLVVDRMIAPASTSGAPIVAPRGAVPASAEAPFPRPGAGDAPPATLLAATRFPSRLPEPELPPRDLFTPTESVRALLIGHPANPAGDGDGNENSRIETARVRAAAFSQAHVLSAVVYDDRFAVAILDGAWVRMGQSIDGCTLVLIVGQNASFDCGGAAVELSVGRLDEPD